MSQSNTEETIDEGITGIKKTWGAVFETESWTTSEVISVSFTDNELARMLIFAAGGLPQALRILGYEAEEMQKAKAAKETPG